MIEKRIVLLEDDYIQAQSIMMRIQYKFGIKPEHYECAHKLIDVKDKDKVDLIISDGNMIISSWKDSVFYKGNYFRNSELIIYTASWTAEREAEALGLRVESKSVMSDHLLDTIDKILNGDQVEKR